MADKLDVNPDQVDRVAEQIASSTEQFRQELQQVDDQVRGLLGAGWRGDPGSQFHDAFAEWAPGSGAGH